MKAGWWHTPFALRDLNEAIPIISDIMPPPYYLETESSQPNSSVSLVLFNMYTYRTGSGFLVPADVQ